MTGFEVVIFTPAELKKLQSDPKRADFMIRLSEYPDWEFILREYEAQKLGAK